MEKSPDTAYFLIATDNHLGVNEKDPVRGNDSFAAFEEILQLAKQYDVDALLLGGDLFHENKPSRKCMHTAMELFRHYCLGSRPSELELLSDPSVNFPGKFGTVNYEDPNFNVALPVFMIHGNHDDPTGEGNLSAIDILSTAGLVNYFGKSREVDDITMMPVLLRKGNTNVALYGLGNLRDERLHRTFLSRKVKMLAPPQENGHEWFNLMLFHQNRVAHTSTSFIPESFLDDSLDLIIWGHEHDNQIEPLYVPQRDFYISQPGSSVVTTLSEGECRRPKMVALLEVTGTQFVLKPLVLKSSRPFVMGDVSLKEASPALLPHDQKAIEKFLCLKIEELIQQANEEWLHRQEWTEVPEGAEVPLPLIRLKVDYSGGFSSFNPHRFGHLFVNRVANPKEVIFFYRRRTVNKTEPILRPMDEFTNPAIAAAVEERSTLKMEDLVKDFLQLQHLDLLPQNEFGDIVKIFVEKDDKESIEGFVKKSLERVCANLQSRVLTSLDDQALRNEFEREKQLREAEWQRLHPGMDALLSHRRTYTEADENKSDADANNSEDYEDSRPPIKRRGASTAAAGRGGRGRGRGRGASASSAVAPPPLTFTTNPTPDTTQTASRWPQRR